MNETPAKKGLSQPVIILVVLAILAAAGILLLVKGGKEEGNTNTTANANGANSNQAGNTVDGNVALKEYRDSQGRYAFSASSSWTVTKLPDEKAGFLLNFNKGSSTKVYVNVVENPKNLSIPALFETFDDTSRFWFGKYSHQSVVINGLAAERFAPFQEDKNEPMRVEVAIQGDWRVGLLSYQYSEDDLSSEFEAVVSSFRFP